MYGPHRKEPCPMCTSFLTSWNGTAVNLRERVAMVVTARSPIERLIEYKERRGFANLPFVSDTSGEYTRTYVNPEDADVPGFCVFSPAMESFVISTAAKWALRWLTPDKIRGALRTPILSG